MKRGINWKALIICLAVVYLVAFVGSIFTTSSVNSEWYNSTKPSITPPGWVFPIAWNILFFLIAISLYISWNKGKNKKIVAWIYGVNLVLNGLWSYLFFGLKNPLAGFLDIILIWFSILVMIFYSWKIDKKAAWLLVPYLLWVSFASILNYLAI